MENKGLIKGSWTYEEDKLLKACINKYGEGKWHLVPQRSGLNRCRKSCRLRWINHLNPNINKKSFAEDEIDMILRLHKLLGNRWSLIAARLPGRTANDVKNYWNTHLQKKVVLVTEEKKEKEIPKETMKSHKVIGSCSSLQEENINMEFQNIDDSFWDSNLGDFSSLWDL